MRMWGGPEKRKVLSSGNYIYIFILLTTIIIAGVAMKIRNKNERMKEMILHIRNKSFENESKFWKAVADNLNRPRRKRYEVNLHRLEKHGKVNEKIVVPGIVLGSGEIKKKLTVAALRFSVKAKEKIEKAGGKCLTIEEMFKENPKGKGLRIMG